MTRALTPTSVWLGLVLLGFWPGSASGQFREPPRPAAYALQNVTVIGADGRRQPGVTLVVRGSTIERLAAGAEIPGDAKLLEGDSLHVYPGLIDGQGDVKVEFPDPEVDRSEVASWDPPRHVQGFQPHRLLAHHLQAVGSDLDGLRKRGVVAAAVHPSGPVMPGRGAFLILRPSADRPEALVANPALGPVMSFQGASRVYPATLFAVIAFYRQKFDDATHLAAHRSAHERNPDRVAIPGWDPDLQVLEEVMAGELPVYFEAEVARDIRRALRLGREHGFRPVIVGGDEAWKVTDELRAADVAVLVSLDFPEPERWKPGKREEAEEEEVGPGDESPPASPSDTARTPPHEGAGPAEAQETQEEETQEPDVAAQREKKRLEDLYSNAGRLAEAGVRFALTSGGGVAELLEGARKAIEYGLDESDALRALTTTPAGLFGAPELARVRQGGVATFVVTDGPLFGEETSILYTFVEGELERVEKKEGPKEEPTVDVTGTWEFVTESSFGTQTSTVELRQEGAEVEGSYRSPFGEAPVRNGVVSGNEITFSVRFEIGDQRFEIEFTGTVEGETASGRGEMSQGTLSWSAERKSGPEAEEIR